MPTCPCRCDGFGHAVSELPTLQVSLMVAVLYLLLAVLRLGFLCSLLSRPIISAFLTSGAMIISSSQVSFPTACPGL